MLGIVFTEFMEMVEEKFSFDMVDNLINNTGIGLYSGFTSVGDYNHNDLIRLVAELSKETKIPVDDIVVNFGCHLFHRFSVNYTQFFENQDCMFDFLERIEEFIHPEVKKLYPKALLPKFFFQHIEPDILKIIYSSKRPFGNLAHGMIEGCGEYFGEKIKIERYNGKNENEVVFFIYRNID